MDFKNMEDSELASVMVNYIGRVEHLMRMFEMYLESSSNFTSENLRRDYSTLKNELREDAHYLDLDRNSQGSELYMGYFRPSIREAAYDGFTVPVNGKVDKYMYYALSEASYKLQKYKSLEEWGKWV